MGGLSAFTTGNYLRQPDVTSLFVKLINVSFMVEFKSGLIKDVSSTEIRSQVLRY